MNPHYNNHWTHQNHDPEAPATPRRQAVADLLALYKAEQQAQAIRQQAWLEAVKVLGKRK